MTYILSHVGLYKGANGDVRAATRWFGEHVNDVTASAAQEARVDHIARAVAPMTLGLPYNGLACSAEYAVDEDGDIAQKAHDHIVDLDRAQGQRTWELRPFASASSSDSGDDLWDTPDGELSANDVDTPESQRCAGRLLPISKAAPYLASSEWVVRAEHADQTAAAHRKWVEGALDPRR